MNSNGRRVLEKVFFKEDEEKKGPQHFESETETFHWDGNEVHLYAFSEK